MQSHLLQILIKAVAQTSALDETGKKTADLGKGVSGLGERLADLGKKGTEAIKTGLTLPFQAALLPLKALTFAVGALGAALAAVGLVGFAKKLMEIPSLLYRVISGTTEWSAELEGMRAALWGIAGEAAPAMLQSLREATYYMSTEMELLGQYNQGYMLLGETLAQRIPEAYQYLSKVALATGDDVNWLMERLTTSVGRLSTRWMAYIGTVVTMEEAQKWAAQTTGKLVSELTNEELQAAMLDRVLMRLEARTAALPTPTETLSQRIKQLGAEFISLRTDLSDHFVPVAKALFTNLINIVKAFQALIREGGALYEPLRKISALFTVLFELAGEGITKLLGLAEKGSAGLEAFVNKILEAGWKAVEWGANIIVNLAIGMIQGASTALVGAMNFISSLLEFWLAPGSAPRIVSNILDWGASAFTEFLRGFTMANFDILEGLQRPLKRALDVLVGMDMLSAVGAGELFIGLSEKMAAAIAHFRETGEVLQGVFDELTSQIGGGYGESLAELWQRQLNLAVAVERLAAAELRLKNAREGEEAAQTKLSKAARDYNKLIREGADPAILRAKLQGVAADYDSLEAARKETEEAEAAEKLAAEEVARRKEQVKLQERLLNQLILMGQAMIDLEKARRKAIGDEEDPYELPPIEWPEIHPPKIDQAFEDLKERIRAKFEELWAMVKAKWEESGVAESIGRLQEAWERLKTALAPVFTWLGERWDDLKKWATDTAWPWILDQWNKWGIWWDENGPGVRTKISEIYQEVKDWSKENLWQWTVDEWGKWKTWWDEDGPAIKEAIGIIRKEFEDFMSWLTGEEGWSLSWESIGSTAWTQLELLRENTSEKLNIVRELFSLAAHAITGDWDAALLDLQSINQSFFNIFDNMTGGRLGKIVEAFQLKFLEIFTLVWDTWEDIKKAASDKFTEIQIMLHEKLEDLFASMGLDLDEMVERWGKIWEDVKDIASEIWRRIVNFVIGKVIDLCTFVKVKIKALQITLRATWTTIKAHAKGIWETIVEVITLGAQEFYDKLVDKINGVLVWLGLQPHRFRDKAKDFMAGFIEGLWSNAGWLIETVTSIVEGAIDALKNYLGISSPSTLLWGLGDQMIDGLIGAIRNKATQVADALRDVVNHAIDEIKRRLGIGSPSKVFAGFGENLVQGFTAGIEKLAKQPALAVGQMAGLTMPAVATAGISGISGGYGTGYRGPNIYITNNFGPDSIRSDRDILKMAEQQQRALTLRGVRDIIQ